jgi:ribosome biogenesis GTPase
MEHDTGALAALGWDAVYARAFEALAREGFRPARVAAEHRDRYVVAFGPAAETAAVIAGRLRYEAQSRLDLPAVGDWVGVAGEQGGASVTSIHAVMPRRSMFVRKVAGEETSAQVVAANVDVAFVVAALSEGLNERRLERYLALAWESGAVPVVILTKLDLADDPSANVAAARCAAPGVEVVPLSSVTGAGLDMVEGLVRPGQTAVLLGPSGAGKSTLVNRLLGHDRLRTADVRDDGKGRHTTTHRQLVRLPGGALLIDTPGMRELQLWDADAGLDAAFADIRALAEQCRFGDCRHDTEPDCAVRGAVEDGRLAADRLESWRKLERELAQLARRQDALATIADRAKAKSAERLVRVRLREKYE